jgi:thiol-disulfide isomerase/thioredoxin
MDKKIWILVALPIILGCQTLLGSPAQQTIAPPTAPQPDSTSTAESPVDHFTSDTFVISRVNIENGPLLDQLASEAAKAKSLGLSPFVEFDATWCPPCQAINASLAAKDDLTLQAFEGIYIIRVDVDEWGWGDGENFKVTAIPVYYQLDDKGLPTGHEIDGSAWQEDIPENFAPVLNAFFHKE